MADFAIWVSACEIEAYRINCAEARNLALEASPVYEPLREVARTGFSGTSSEVLLLLSKLVGDSTRRSQRWPKAPNALGNVLPRMSGSLRAGGIEIHFNRADHQGRRIISVKAASLVPQRSSASSAPRERQNLAEQAVFAQRERAGKALQDRFSRADSLADESALRFRAREKAPLLSGIIAATGG